MMQRKSEKLKSARRSRSKIASSFASMTGFGKGSAEMGGVLVEVEIRSVNHRFLEISCKLPKTYGEFEMALRTIISAALSRGRIEVYVARSFIKTNGAGIVFNQELYNKLFSLFRRAVGKHGKLDSASERELGLEILKRSEVLGIGEGKIDYSLEEKLVLKALSAALNSLSEMRRREGSRLETEVRGRFTNIAKLHEEVREMANSAPERQKERLHARLKRLSPEISIDPARLAQEVVLISDRIDVTEEIVRLESHLTEFSKAINRPPQGKKLDFLLQEMGREFNTIASKAQEASIQQKVVDAKVELEKLKEQLQNVE